MTKQELLQHCRQNKRIHKDDLILSICSQKKVLDVGCIGQDRDFSAPNWLHNKIKSVASVVHGVDILTNLIAQLKVKGYLMYSVEELQAMNEKYEIIILSDVIEHVNNPVEFLAFYSQFLAENGCMIVSTPNANRANDFVNILFNNNYSTNPEHTFWFCPKTFAEVTERAKLTIKNFHWAHHYYTASNVKGFYQKFKFFIINRLIGMRSNFSPNMIFIITRPV
ncbi:MAG: methyltransferase domain-containing protein [Cytophagia bacterium]|nr:methyltransferase domain-containing protein [Cytophagia bacterium]